MKLLISWVGPWLDSGEAAMILSMVNAMREKIHNPSITILTAYPLQKIDIVKYGEYDLKVLPGMSSGIYSILPKLEFLKFKLLKALVALPLFLAPIAKSTLWLILHKGLRIDAGFLSRNNGAMIRECRDANCYIFCGGENLTNLGPGLIIALYEIIFAKLLGKPVMIWANSLGPFNSKSIRPFVKWALNKVDLITTREAISMKILDDLGVTAPVFVTADAAFTLRPIPQKDAMTLLEHETGIPKNELIVGVTAILWHFPGQRGKDDDAFENYIGAMADSIDYMITKLNAYIIFFPHNRTIFPGRNDRIASMKIFDKIENKSKVVILTKDYTPEQLKGMYGCMGLFIGTRFHSCIFALSMNVPTIAIGYTHKAKGIMEMLDLEDYVCDINTITTYDLTSKIDKIWTERDEVKRKLEKNIRVMQAKSMDNARLAIEYLKLQETHKGNG